QGDTGRPGVIEAMLTSNGFQPRVRGTVSVVNEWPDTDTAVRALAAAGPSVPAINAVGFDTFCREVRQGVEPMDVPGLSIRIESELGWIVASRNQRCSGGRS